MNQGYRFAVIYSKSDPTVNMIILKESSCDYFGKPYSDSTRVLCEELGLEGCSNSGTKIDERSWWDKLLHP